MSFDGFDEVMPLTDNTQIVTNDKGLILNDPLDLSMADYNNDATIELLSEKLIEAEKDYGLFNKKTVAIRKQLDDLKLSYAKQNGLTPKMFFTHVKASFTPVEVLNLDVRLKKIKGIIDYLDKCGQLGSKEYYQKLLVANAKESEILTIGINSWVPRSSISDYIHHVKHDGNKVAYLRNLRDFPRIIPKDIQEKIQTCKDKKVFDSFEILYLDYSDASKKTESSQTKKERDPILFGILKELPDRMYCIAYWEDDLCHLSPEELLDHLDEFEFIPPADEVTDEYINKTKEEVDKMLAMVRPRIALAEDNKKKSILNKMLFWK